MENRNVASIEAQVYPLKEPRNNTLAMASLTIGGCFAVRGVKVVQGRNGPFVSMPQAKDGKGGYQDICFPISKEVREQVSRLVLDMYSLLSVPQITKDTLQGIGVSGKAMRAMYWELICRCEEKWADAWDDAIRWMIDHMIRMARAYGETLPEIAYTVTIEHLYPLVDDEEEERERDLSEVARQARSRRSYISKWHQSDDPEAELTQIKAERQLLEDVWANGME